MLVRTRERASASTRGFRSVSIRKSIAMRAGSRESALADSCFPSRRERD
jgi:hypothetical protein